MGQSNRVYVHVPGRERDVLLMGEQGSGTELDGATSGCLGDPSRGCTWASAPRTSDMSRYGTTVAVRLMTVNDAVETVDPAHVGTVIEASLAACTHMARTLRANPPDSRLTDGERAQLVAAANAFRRQTAVAVTVMSNRNQAVPEHWWKQLVTLDAALGSSDQLTGMSPVQR